MVGMKWGVGREDRLRLGLWVWIRESLGRKD
jgi:hypothetical protein